MTLYRGAAPTASCRATAWHDDDPPRHVYIFGAWYYCFTIVNFCSAAMRPSYQSWNVQIPGTISQS
jgi:hypothetical protein